MKVFIGGKLYDSRRDVIGIVLTDQDKQNIANMLPTATVYSEFVSTGQGTEPGLREFEPACVEKLLESIKIRAALDGSAGAGQVAWIDEGVEK